MALQVAQYTVGTATPVLVVKSHHMAQDVTIHNQNKSSNHYAFLGNSDVTAENGIHIDPGETLQLKIQANDVVYAISNVDDLTVAVLQSLQ